MARDVYLLTYPVARKRFNGAKAHWGIFIPYHRPVPSSATNAPPTVGKVIHVTGTPFTGYGLEFKRNYDLEKTGRYWKQFLLGSVEENFVEAYRNEDEDEEEAGKVVIDIVPRDALEVEAKKIDPPGPSKEPLNPNVGRRCQEWTREYMAWLVRRGIVSPTALEVLDTAKAIETASEEGNRN